MTFITTETYDELSNKSAAIIATQILANPKSVLGLATGSSPIGTYQKLIENYKRGELDFSEIRTVNLDEYVGISEDNHQSYRYFMNETLFNHINICKSNTYVPNGCAENLNIEALEYDRIIKRLGGIDLQLLGIGLDGHIGFNEPDNVFIKETHTVELDRSTIRANARFFADESEVPQKAITMGMEGIMSSKQVLLIANGESKKEIIEKAFFGPITPKIPASILQLHNNLTVIYSKT